MRKKLSALKTKAVSSPVATRILSRAAGALKSSMPPGVFMFHQGRCGSTVVSLMLDQHPRIVAFGEVFEKSFQKRSLASSPKDILRARRVQAFKRIPIVEAKFFECQHLSLTGTSIEEFVHLTKEAGYAKFIVLDRENYLRVLTSGLIGIERGRRYHYFSGENVPETKVKVDPSAVEYFSLSGEMPEIFAYMENQYARLRAALAGEDVLHLSYEKHISDDPAVAYGMICRWLGLEPMPVNVRLQRASPRGAKDVIANWEEVRDALGGTRYAWMID